MKLNNNRGLKTRKALYNAVRMDLYEQLKKLSDETKIPMSNLHDLLYN